MVPLFDFWLNNTFPNPAQVGASVRDVNGVLITVGATVKFVGTVVAINSNDPHYGTIAVAPLHPNGQPEVFWSDYALPQSANYPTPNPQLPSGVTGFEGVQLVVGS